MPFILVFSYCHYDVDIYIIWIAIFIECTTDNINRTVADVRAIFNKTGGELGKNGSLEFLFSKKGVFLIKRLRRKRKIKNLLKG